MKNALILAGIAAASFAAPAQAANLLTFDFDSGPVGGAGVTGSIGPFTYETAAAGAWNAGGWSGQYGANRTGGDPATFFSISLANLAAHTTISASFILGFLESWDSYDGGCCAPDNLEVWIDGVQVANMTANNALGTINDFDGGTILAQYVQANDNGYYSDTLVDMAGAPFLTFAHTASTLNFQIRASGAGWQGGGDEGWGIDNINFTYDAAAVPEPGTWAMMLAGFGAIGFAMRRRPRRTAVQFA